MTETVDVAELLQAAARGDQQAWDRLVDRYMSLVISVIRRYRLSDKDAEDVSQTVWLRLVEYIDRIREPRALPGWIATTTKNEALRLLKAKSLVDPTNPSAGGPLDLDSDSLELDDSLLRDGAASGDTRRARGVGATPAATAGTAGRRPADVLSGHQQADRDAGRQHRSDQGPLSGPAEGNGADSGPTLDGEVRQSGRWTAMTSARWADDDEELLAMIKAAVAGRDRADRPVRRGSARVDPASGRAIADRRRGNGPDAAGGEGGATPGEPSTRNSTG